MAKCTDCDGTRVFGGGDGVCSECHGTGGTGNPLDALADAINILSDETAKCHKCNGSGECTTCNGTGEV